MSTLLPCPFCGNEARLRGSNNGPLIVGWFVECSRCEVSGPRSDETDSGSSVIEAWNQRAQTAQAVPLLTDDPLFVFAQEVIHGAYKPDELKDAAMRAIRHHSAVRAKLGVAVPMTDPQLQTSEERRATGERIASMIRVEEVGADLIRRARGIVVGHQKGSISLVQRRLRISYNTAAKLLEALEQEGVVSPQRQNGQREVLVLPDISGIVGKEGA